MYSVGTKHILQLFAFALLLLIFIDVHGVEATSRTGGRALLLLNTTAMPLQGTGWGCNGLAPSINLRSMQDVPAAAQVVVSAAVPLYNSNDHAAAACVYESLLWKLVNSSWLSPEDPLSALASHTLNVSQALASAPMSVWPVDLGSGAVGGLVLAGTTQPGNSDPTAVNSASTAGTSSGENTTTDSGKGGSNSLTGAASTTHTPTASPGTKALTNSTMSGEGQEPQPESSQAGSPNGTQTETADQTRSWTVRWAMEALVGWENLLGACNAMASSAHSQQVLQIAGYLRLKHPEQCGLSLLIGAEQLRIVCGAALLASPEPSSAGGQTMSLFAAPTATPDPTAVDNIKAMNARLSAIIARTPSQAMEERIYVLADAVASVSNITISDGATSQGKVQYRTPPSFWPPDAAGHAGCNQAEGCVVSSMSVLQTLLFSLGGLLGFLIVGLFTCVLWRRARTVRRSRVGASEGNGLPTAIVPVEGPSDPDDEPTYELKSPLARALRAITVWLPNGLAAVAFEERKPRGDVEAGSQATTPRTPKEA